MLPQSVDALIKANSDYDAYMKCFALCAKNHRKGLHVDSIYMYCSFLTVIINKINDNNEVINADEIIFDTIRRIVGIYTNQHYNIPCNEETISLAYKIISEYLRISNDGILEKYDKNFAPLIRWSSANSFKYGNPAILTLEAECQSYAKEFEKDCDNFISIGKQVSRGCYVPKHLVLASDKLTASIVLRCVISENFKLANEILMTVAENNKELFESDCINLARLTLSSVMSEAKQAMKMLKVRTKGIIASMHGEHLIEEIMEKYFPEEQQRDDVD